MAYFKPGFSFSMLGSEADKTRDLWLVQTLTACCALFGAYELIERAASQIGCPWSEHYPPAQERYASVRTYCITDLRLDESVFTSHASSAPDTVMNNFIRLAAQINWH